jgi:prepilin-type N-terminal cleavage/methylation domain-containing protein
MLKAKRSRLGFTLIEVLTVVAIVAILAGIILAISGSVGERSAISRAEAELAVLGQALERFRQTHGDYPWTTGSDGFHDLYAALIGMQSVRGTPFPTAGGTAKRQHFVDPGTLTVGRIDRTEPVEIRPEMAGDVLLTLDADFRLHFFMDPWGSPYIYLYRSGPDDGWQRRGYILLSLGPSGAALRPGSLEAHGIPSSGILPPDYRDQPNAHDNIFAE